MNKKYGIFIGAVAIAMIMVSTPLIPALETTSLSSGTKTTIVQQPNVVYPKDSYSSDSVLAKLKSLEQKYCNYPVILAACQEIKDKFYSADETCLEIAYNIFWALIQGWGILKTMSLLIEAGGFVGILLTIAIGGPLALVVSYALFYFIDMFIKQCIKPLIPTTSGISIGCPCAQIQ